LEESRTKKSIRNIIISVAMLLISFIINFIYRRLFVEVFDVQYLGVTSIFTNVTSLLSLAELGFGAAVMYALYRPMLTNDTCMVAQIIKYFKKIYYIIASVVMVMGLLIIPLLPYIIKDMPNLTPNVYIMYIFYLTGTVLSYFNAYKTTLLQSDQKEYIVKIVVTIVSIGTKVLIILLLLFIKSFYVVLVIENSVNIITNAVLTLIINKRYPFLKQKTEKISLNMRKSIKKYTASMFTHKLGGVILSITDILLISIFFGATSNGYYANYLLVTTSINSVINVFYSGMQASLGQCVAENNQEKTFELFKIINLLCVWIAFFTTAGILFVSKSFVILWLGQEYVVDNFLLLMISLSFLLENMSRSSGLFISATGVFNKTAYLSIIYAFANFGFSLLFIWLIGIPGVFLGTVVARLIVFPVENYYLCKYGIKIKVIEFYKKLFLQIVVGLLGFFALYGLSLVKIENNILTLIYRLAMVILVPNILFIIVYYRTNELKSIFKILKLDKLMNKIKGNKVK